VKSVTGGMGEIQKLEECHIPGVASLYRRHEDLIAGAVPQSIPGYLFAMAGRHASFRRAGHGVLVRRRDPEILTCVLIGNRRAGREVAG
jgi:hypothetical protein